MEIKWLRITVRQHTGGGGCGGVGAASGIQESSPMRAVAGVRSTRQERARVSQQNHRAICLRILVAEWVRAASEHHTVH